MSRWDSASKLRRPTHKPVEAGETGSTGIVAGPAVKIETRALVVRVIIVFGAPIEHYTYTHSYTSSGQLRARLDAVREGLLRRIEHGSRELITRTDFDALEASHGQDGAPKPLRFTISYHVTSNDGQAVKEEQRTYSSYQQQALGMAAARELCLATDRLVGQFLLRHDTGFRWTAGPVQEDFTMESSLCQTPDIGGCSYPQPLSCIPRMRFLHASQQFEFVPGYVVEVSLERRGVVEGAAGAKTGPTAWQKTTLRAASRQTAPLTLQAAEDILWRVAAALQGALEAKKRAFDEHCRMWGDGDGEDAGGGSMRLKGKTAGAVNSSAAPRCQHFAPGALDVRVRVFNMLGPAFGHLERRVRTDLVLFRDGVGLQRFIDGLRREVSSARDGADEAVLRRPDFEFRVVEMACNRRLNRWSVRNPITLTLGPEKSYSRRTVAALLARLHTCIAAELRGSGVRIDVRAWKRGHLILNKTLVASLGGPKSRESAFTNASAERDYYCDRLDARLREEMWAVCKDTLSLDDVNQQLDRDGADELVVSAGEDEYADDEDEVNEAESVAVTSQDEDEHEAESVAVTSQDEGEHEAKSVAVTGQVEDEHGPKSVAVTRQDEDEHDAKSVTITRQGEGELEAKSVAITSQDEEEHEAKSVAVTSQDKGEHEAESVAVASQDEGGHDVKSGAVTSQDTVEPETALKDMEDADTHGADLETADGTRLEDADGVHSEDADADGAHLTVADADGADLNKEAAVDSAVLQSTDRDMDMETAARDTEMTPQMDHTIEMTAAESPSPTSPEAAHSREATPELAETPVSSPSSRSSTPSLISAGADDDEQPSPRHSLLETPQGLDVAKALPEREPFFVNILSDEGETQLQQHRDEQPEQGVVNLGGETAHAAAAKRPALYARSRPRPPRSRPLSLLSLSGSTSPSALEDIRRLSMQLAPTAHGSDDAAAMVRTVKSLALDCEGTGNLHDENREAWAATGESAAALPSRPATPSFERLLLHVERTAPSGVDIVVGDEWLTGGEDDDHDDGEREEAVDEEVGGGSLLAASAVIEVDSFSQTRGDLFEAERRLGYVSLQVPTAMPGRADEGVVARRGGDGVDPTPLQDTPAENTGKEGSLDFSHAADPVLQQEAPAENTGKEGSLDLSHAETSPLSSHETRHSRAVDEEDDLITDEEEAEVAGKAVASTTRPGLGPRPLSMTAACLGLHESARLFDVGLRNSLLGIVRSPSRQGLSRGLSAL